MTDFKNKSIRKGPPPSQVLSKIDAEKHPKKSGPKWLKLLKKHFIWSTLIVVVLLISIKMGWRIVTLAEEFSLKEVILSAFSEKIKTDDENHTNILLLGTGDNTHSGYTLTDTIIVASIDHDLKKVSMLSIPRDFHITIDELYGGNRINSISELYAEKEMVENGTEEKQAYLKSYDVLSKTVSEVLGIPIHYYARVDFKAFEEIVDAVGGIDVQVKETIADPYYPAGNGSIDYTTFYIEEGLQHLDGETALKYVRSRKTTSDFDRAERQQQVLEALKEKALQLGMLKKPNQLKQVYDAVSNNMDTNIQWSEMVYLAKMASKFDRNNLSTWVLNDNPVAPGGFLYTPDREMYGGAYVLVPYTDDYSDIQAFADLVLMHPEVHAHPLTYQVLNGTLSSGLATQTMNYLARFGFEVVRFGNGPDREILATQAIPVKALLTAQDPESESNPNLTQLDYLMTTLFPVGTISTQLPVEYSPAEWPTEADVILELGQDAVEWIKANRKRVY